MPALRPLASGWLGSGKNPLFRAIFDTLWRPHQFDSRIATPNGVSAQVHDPKRRARILMRHAADRSMILRSNDPGAQARPRPPNPRLPSLAQSHTRIATLSATSTFSINLITRNLPTLHPEIPGLKIGSLPRERLVHNTAYATKDHLTLAGPPPAEQELGMIS